MKRMDGVLDTLPRRDKVEMRYHVSTRNGRKVITRVPWHRDGDRWYSGVPGPEMAHGDLRFLISEFAGRID